MDSANTVIIGGGVAGLTAGIFTVRADCHTRMINSGTSILNRNAHLENFPGFPAGINPRLFLDLLKEQYRNHGGKLCQERVTNVRKKNDLFEVEYSDQILTAERIIVASWSDLSYLDDINPETEEKDGKKFLQTDRWGRTSIKNLYAAGRIAGVYHQAIVAAGHGATTALTLLEDSDSEFYHDWVAPEGYFTNRDRDIPEGCSEIERSEWKSRSTEAKESIMEFLSLDRINQPEPHPSLETETDEIDE